MSELRVRDLMTSNVVTVQSVDSVATAYELMLDHRFRHLVVVDGTRPVGILTEADFVRFFALAGQRPVSADLAMAGLGAVS